MRQWRNHEAGLRKLGRGGQPARGVAVDLRGHGKSPRATHDLGLEDLAGDLHETVSALLGTGERVDIMLGHSLGALAALELCREHRGLIERLVLEEPPGSESIDFDEISRMAEADVARAREAPEAHKREQLQENPSWSEGDSVANVESLRDCDTEPVAAMVRNGLRYDLTALIGSVEVPTLLVLGSEARGSALPEPERTAVADALRRGTVGTFDADHGVHRDDFEGYVRLLGNWLDSTKA
ncbi:MAG: alpha/beta hydrolase [Actinobacteria bacterium]|nr:alpha/beta hydrolase [Actinomycetota bacterium]